MQAGFKFFTNGLIYEPLARHARKPLERWRNQRKVVMRLSAGPRASVARMLRGLIFDHNLLRRKLRRQLLCHALFARKMRFVVCQFLVRLTLGAHTG